MHFHIFLIDMETDKILERIESLGVTRVYSRLESIASSIMDVMAQLELTVHRCHLFGFVWSLRLILRYSCKLRVIKKQLSNNLNNEKINT